MACLVVTFVALVVCRIMSAEKGANLWHDSTTDRLDYIDLASTEAFRLLLNFELDP